MDAKSDDARNRYAITVLLVLVIAAGLATRRFGELLPVFVVANAGDALWTVAAFLGLAWLFSKSPSLALGIGAFAISVAVECSQLLDVGWLNQIRATMLGRLLLGSGFIWIDFPRYFVGALVATVVDWFVTKRLSLSRQFKP